MQTFGENESILATGSVLNVLLGHVSPQTGGGWGGGLHLEEVRKDLRAGTQTVTQLN